MWTITIKELRLLLYSPKFLVLSLASFVLIALALFNGYQQYQAERATISQMQQMRETALMESESPSDLFQYGSVLRLPQRLSLFTIGITGAVGREGTPGRMNNSASFRESRYEQDPVLALFGELDLAFIVGIALSLFAILLSYNAVSGEREAGTLQLIAANPVRRSSIILGKLIGGYIPLALMFLLPFIFGLLALITLTDITFSGEEWARIALMAGVALLYLAVFHIAGLAVSTLTRQSFVSFLICLLIWVLSCFVLPRFAIQGALLTDPPMSAQAYGSRLNAIREDSFTLNSTLFADYLKNHRMTMDEYRTRMREVQTYVGEAFGAEIRRRYSMLATEYQLQREKLRDAVARNALVSPTAELQLALMSLSESGPELMEEYRQQVVPYGAAFDTWREELMQKFAQNKRAFGFGMSFKTDKDGYMTAMPLEQKSGEKLDLAGLPRFTYHLVRLDVLINHLLFAVAQLALAAIIPFAIAWVAFLRYDVR